MDDQGSTESLLRKYESPDGTDSSVSTQILINENAISNSTDSLVNERIEKLLDRVHLVDNASTLLDLSNSSEKSTSSVLEQALLDELEIAELAKKTQNNGQLDIIAQEKQQWHVYEEINPILAILFNKIQVFLLRNRLSLDFLKIFKSYMNHITKSGMNPLEDQYFLELQNELSDSFEFGPVMEEILNKFLLRPENLIMKLTLFEHKMTLRFFQRFFSTWRLRCEMKLSLIQLEKIWDQYMQRKYISLWTRKYHYFESELMGQGREFKVFTLLSFAFDKWLGMFDTNGARNGLADHFFLDHVFRNLKKNMKVLKCREAKATIKFDQKCTHHALNTMKLKFAESEFDIAKTYLKKRQFEKLAIKFHQNKLLEARGVFTETVFTLGPCLKRWHEKTQYVAAHLDQLAHLEAHFCKQKTFSFLKSINERNQKELRLSKRFDLLLVRYTFKHQWQKQFQQHINLYNFWAIQNQRFSKSFLDMWQDRLIANLRAYHFYRKQCSFQALSLWKIRLNAKICIKEKSRKTLEKTFRKWILAARQNSKLNEFEQRFPTKEVFKTWQKKCQSQHNSTGLALHHYEENLLRNAMHKWAEELLLVNEMNGRSIIYEKIRALSTIKRGIEHIRDVNEIEENYEPLLLSKKRLCRCLLYWKEKAMLSRSRKLSLLLRDYEIAAEEISKHRYLQLWGQRFEFYQSECALKSVLKYERSLERHTFADIMSKMANRARLLEISDELRNKSIRLSMFYTWRAHLGYLNELTKRAETEVNKSNLSLLLGYLKVWSMLILKSKRNHETVQIFRKRWDRAGVRGLLLLWKNRADYSLNTDEWGNEEVKNREKKLELGYNLVTPVRYTSSRTNTIPGSEGVKQYRIEAMRSHYSKVRRAIPSPIKSSTTLNSIAKKKFSESNTTASWASHSSPPPRISLERINKNLASKIDNINFERIPYVKLDPFIEPNGYSDPVLDRSLLELEEDTQFDESPTRRT